MRRTVIFACAATVLLPSAASAATLRASHGFRISAVVHEQARQWPAQQRAALRSLGAVKIFRDVRPSAAAHPSISQQFVQLASLIPAGDLNGDKRADVLDARQSPYNPSVGTLGVTARDGRTGRPLWHRVLHERAGNETALMVEPLGEHGKPAVLAIDLFQTIESNTPVSATVRLQAFAGRTGGPLWRRTLTGTYGAANSEVNIPSIDGVIHDAKGPATDILVSLASTVPSPNSFQVTPEVISGVDGVLHQPGSSFASAEDYPDLRPIPDVNGDGLADILVLVAGSPGFELAETGRLGARIWKTSVVPVAASETGVVVIGPYSHRAYPDLAFESFDAVPSAIEFTVLQGRTGDVVWQRTANTLYLLGRAGKHLMPAVALGTYAPPSPPGVFTLGVAYTAITATNKVLYARKISLSLKTPPGVTSESGGGGIGPLGDVEPDGSADLLVDLQVRATAPGVSISKILNGYIDARNGVFRKVTFDIGAAGSLHRGKGTDLLGLTFVKGTPHLTALKGTTRRRYYRRAVPGLHGINAGAVSGLRVSGHACSDISLATVNGAHDVLGVLSARGHWLWRVRFNRSQPTGGTVTRAKPRKHFCV